ncbi:bifunctional (p)ppGpp synthetase/guanosine-3',5'-bis(diphosphate) 3'-pyrophosphohydrolase [Patescibacteria group bacterium]|nr:MAG: bifunctional (p)ppGpp synthetase/guanosine-3',5'-bis(diphosphate) 3'-pyrophosphohydrolase [Patescibacteria group bacterium]
MEPKNPLKPTADELFAIARKQYPGADLSLLERAYSFAAVAHDGRKRYSGDPYIIHPIAVAISLAQMRLALPVVVAGMLHDVLEDSPTSVEELRAGFGGDVTQMVESVTKLGTVKYRGVERYAENLRRMFLAMAQDVRVVFIKFADRIHNLRTLDAVPENKRRRIALESLELYAPIANRLSMGEIRGTIEDLSFRYIFPKEYEWVAGLVRGQLDQKQLYLERLKTVVGKELARAGVPVDSMSGRTKHLYSLYKKLLRHDRDITKIHDLVALRILVPTVSDCYATLGVIHQRWKPLKGRIKDYIAQPKPNGYQSLHTTVFAEDGEIIEVQIRTVEMHEMNEYGAAAHWQYTETGKRSRRPDKTLPWMNEIAKIQKEVGDHKEFLEKLETLKLDVFTNRIFVFTPQGDVIDLPEDATPVDFAYAIHTEVGNHCAGARINDEIAALHRPLKNGDVVEIMTDKKRSRPSGDWLKFVKTHNARSKIRDKVKSPADWLLSLLPPAPKRPSRKDG